MKTDIFNLIILDESGSMECQRRQTIAGCNETINTIRAAQAKFGATQHNLVSIFAFQSDGSRRSRYLVKLRPVDDVKHIGPQDYEPWGGTPLFDAVGATLTDLKAAAKESPMAVGNVTVITDGMENSSRHYTHGMVVKMIDELKELGWTFNFIGANIDVDSVAAKLHFQNAMAFEQTDEGTQGMFKRERASRMSWNSRVNEAVCYSCDARSLRGRLREEAEDYFAHAEDEEDGAKGK